MLVHLADITCGFLYRILPVEFLDLTTESLKRLYITHWFIILVQMFKNVLDQFYFHSRGSIFKLWNKSAVN